MDCINCGGPVVNERNFTCSETCAYQSRGKKTKLAITVTLPENEVNSIKEILQKRYITDIQLLIRHSKVSCGKRVMARYLVENEELNLLYSKTYKYLSHKIQSLSHEKYNELVCDIQHLSYSLLEKKWNIGVKSLTKLCTLIYGSKPDLRPTKEETYNKHRINRSLIGSANETYIEKIVRGVLLALGVDFKCEHYLVPKKYRVDFLIGSTKIIEVNGNYWHGYNTKYEELDKNVKKLLDNYHDKTEYIFENDFQLLEIWEHEINKNLSEIVNKIKNYVAI